MAPSRLMVIFRDYVRMNPYYPKTDSGGHIIQSVEKWLVDTKQSQNQYRVEGNIEPNVQFNAE